MQNTADGLRICDSSSGLCSCDLLAALRAVHALDVERDQGGHERREEEGDRADPLDAADEVSRVEDDRPCRVGGGDDEEEGGQQPPQVRVGAHYFTSPPAASTTGASGARSDERRVGKGGSVR